MTEPTSPRTQHDAFPPRRALVLILSVITLAWVSLDVLLAPAGQPF